MLIIFYESKQTKKKELNNQNKQTALQYILPSQYTFVINVILKEYKQTK